MGGSSHGLLERTSTHECVERDYELRLSQREAEAFLTLAIQILLADLLATSAILRHQFLLQPRLQLQPRFVSAVQ